MKKKSLVFESRASYVQVTRNILNNFAKLKEQTNLLSKHF